MTMRKMLFALAAGASMFLFSAQDASACSHQRAPHAGHEVVGQSHGTHMHRKTAVGVEAAHASHAGGLKRLTPDAPPERPAGNKLSPAPVKPQFGEFEEDEEAYGSCIHGNGCTCKGPRSHRRTCGTEEDCHAHPGLRCTWA